MVNHDFIHITGIALKKIEEDIDKINQRRFNNQLKVEYLKAPSNWDKERDTIYVSYKESDMGLWINEDNILEIRNQGYQYFKWVGYIIMTELAVKYDVFKSSDGAGEDKWKGDLSRYNTYFDYLMMIREDTIINRIICKRIAKQDCKQTGLKALGEHK